MDASPISPLLFPKPGAAEGDVSAVLSGVAARAWPVVRFSYVVEPALLWLPAGPEPGICRDRASVPVGSPEAHPPGGPVLPAGGL